MPLLLLALLPERLPAQPLTATTHYQFDLSVESRPAAGLPDTLVWVIPNPASERLDTLPSPFLQGLVRAALESLEPKPAEVTPILESTLRNYIQTYRQDEYPRLGFLLQDLRYALDGGPAAADPPAPAAPGKTGRLTIAFDLVRPRIGSLSIQVDSAQAFQAESRGEEPLTLTLALKDARAQQERPSIALTPEEEGIPVALHYAEEDLKDAQGNLRGGDEAQARIAVQNALARVAWLAFVRARTTRMPSQPSALSDIALYAPAPFAEQLDAVRTAVEGAFTIPDLVSGGDNISIAVGIEDTADPDDPNVAATAHPWLIRVTNVPLIGPVLLDVPAYDWEEGFRKVDPAGAEKIKRDREARATRILEETKPELERLGLEMTPGEYGWQRLEEFSRSLRRRYQLDALRYDMTATDTGLQLNGSLFLPAVIKTVTGTGGVGYNVEDRLTGDASIRTDNLLGTGETFGLAFKGGEQMQKATLDARLHRDTAHISAEWRLNGLYLQDRDQRFGNPGGSRIEDRESGAETGLAFRYDTLSRQERGAAAQSSDGSFYTPHGYRGISTLDVGLEYRDVDLTARGITPSQPGEGQLSAVTFTLSQTLQHTPHLERAFGLGYLEASVSGAAQKGLRVLGGDFDYTRYDVSAQLTLFFGGPAAPRNLFVRWRQGFASSTSETPLFRLPRIGGAETVRGIENGEITEPDILYRQIELGLRLLAIVAAFRGGGPAASPPAPEAAPRQPSPLDHAYLKGFYDVGRTPDALKFGNVLWVTPGVEGYGVSLELRELPVNDRKAAITLGYAYSPDSALHRSGVFFTAVTLEF